MKKRILALVCLLVLLAVCALPIMAQEQEQAPSAEEQTGERGILIPVVVTVIAVGAVVIGLAVVLPVSIKAKKNP